MIPIIYIAHTHVLKRRILSLPFEPRPAGVEREPAAGELVPLPDVAQRLGLAAEREGAQEGALAGALHGKPETGTIKLLANN